MYLITSLMTFFLNGFSFFALLTVSFQNGRMTWLINPFTEVEMLKEFKEFAIRGNVIDLAVAVIIGGAFGKIVSSLVDDIIMPLVGLLIGGIDFKSLAFTIGSAKITYGAFLQNVVDFIIIAFVIFLMVRAMNRLKRQPPETPTTKECPYCYSTIPLKAVRCPDCTSQLK
jgi:large conductance mechanosensitive channel